MLRADKISENSQTGVVLVAVLVIASLFIVMAGGLAMLQIYQNKLYRQQVAKIEALHIAEAGANYYRWHLAHAQDDFFDGTGADPGPAGEPYGPYEHTYVAPSSGVSGKYSLEITPPPSGSTIVKIKSTGWLDDYPNIKRSVEVRYGIPSLAHFSFLSGSDVWFGESESVVGEMHSNGGVRMDGSNDSIIASAREAFTCPSGLGCDTQATCQSPCTWYVASSSCGCPGIFGDGPDSSLWSYPVPQIALNSVTMDLDALKSSATTSCGYFKVTGSNKGYHITFKSDGTFDARVVQTLMAAVSQRNDDWSVTSPYYVNYAEQYNAQGAITNCVIPSNGVIFVEDGDVWVDGTVNGRVTLAAASLPDQANKRRTIFINDSIRYLARDGTNVLGLIAQKDIRVPKYAPTNLVIDAIMLAQWGRVYYNLHPSGQRSVKTSIEVYGGIITNLTWTWSWVNGSGAVIDGYATTTSIYDSDVTYSPPPSFPTSGEYAFISWEEK